MSDIDQRIRERAFQLWEQAGRPHERSEEFWFAACQEVEGDVPPVGDQPGGAVDFPPDERSLEDAPSVAVSEVSSLPGEVPPGQVASAEAAVPQVHPAEPAAGEATAPLRKAPPQGEPARKAAASDPDGSKRPRPATRPAPPPTRPGPRPDPARPGRG